MNFLLVNIPAFFSAICMEQGVQILFPPQPKRWKRVVLCFLLWNVFAMPSWVGDENPILLFPFFMLGFLVLLTGPKLPRLIVGGILYTLFVSANSIFDSLERIGWVLILEYSCKMLIWCVLALLLKHFIPAGGLRLSKRLWLLLGGLTLGPLMAMLSLSIWGYRSVPSEHFDFYYAALKRLGLTVLPFAFISALALLIAAVVLSRHERLEQENNLAALREVYYTGVKQEQTRLQTLRHDLRNHITVLQGLLIQGKQEELSQYLAQLSDSPALDSGKRYTKNETANIVICSKVAEMELAGLIPNFELLLPEKIAIPAPELCMLLGNALDNAIAGVAGAANPTITLRARLEKGMFMLQVENAVGNIVHADLTTTKADANHHGFGLAGMREIAIRYGGSMEAGVMDGSFKLLICFPCKE